MKTKLVSISALAVMLILVFFLTNLYEEPFLKTEIIYNSSDDGFYVNDYVVFIENYPKPIVVNKKTGLGMELGLEMSGLPDENEPFVLKNYTLNTSSITEYSYIENKLSITKHDLQTYKTSNLVKRINSVLPQERYQQYTKDSTVFSGNTNTQIYFNKMYSVISEELYREKRKISVKPLLFQNYSLDNEEIFYVGNDFNIYRYNEGKTEKVAEDALTLYLTKEYLYYTDKKTRMTVQLNRDDFLLELEYPVDSAIKIRENSQYTFFLKNRELLIYRDGELHKSFNNVSRFDIDSNQIYLLDINNNVDIIDLTTLERERFWNGT